MELNINGRIISLVTNLSQEDVVGLKEMMSFEFKTVEEAVTEWGGIILDMEAQINNVNNKKEEVKMEVLKKTVAVYVVVNPHYKFGVTKEWLLGTGKRIDAKLVREEAYEMGFMEFMEKASAITCKKALEVVLAKTEAMAKALAKPQVAAPKITKTVEGGSGLTGPSGKKGFAVDYMVKELKAGKGQVKGKAQWLADFIQTSVKQVTVDNLIMEIEDGTLWVSFKREYYGAQKARCQHALGVLKRACYKTDLEYRGVQGGRLPIRVAGTWKTPEI